MRRLPAVVALAATLSPGCGYELARGASSQRVAPELGDVASPHAAVASAELDGARSELARSGALSSSPDAATLRVDLVRVDETAEGIVAPPGGLAPRARAIRVEVVGRARLVRNGRVERDTGDVRAAEAVSAAPSPDAGFSAASAAGEVAARRLGARLARRILGFPEPTEP